MKIKKMLELQSFFSAYFPDADPDADDQATRAFISASSRETQQQVISQIRILLVDPEFSVEELGAEANRWFSDIEEARTWLRQIISMLEGAQVKESVVVKDSNGTLLSEGDSVSVIKDLKVKGGSSD